MKFNSKSRHLLAAKYLLSLTFAGICSIFSANAQFYTDGTDPGRIKWSQVQTQNFKIIYPSGLDSLARVYGQQLEKWRIPVSSSAGYAPNQQYKKPMPVILHSFTGDANGSVTWTPKRMDLYTVKDAYSSEPMPWDQNLAIHESRHVSQMQFGFDGAFKIGHYLIGEMMEGALSGVYPNVAFFEGDAVVAETALTRSGRGRTADFLEWYRVSLDNGDMRNYYRWRYDSQKKYTPNHYTIGYFTIAGVRYLYDAPLFVQRYFERLTHGNPIRFNNFQKTIKEFSGKKFNESFQEISQTFLDIWQKEDALRLPIRSYEPVVSLPKRYTEYKSGEFDSTGNYYAVKRSLSDPVYLVKISPEGKEDILRPFSATTSKLVYSALQNRLYWSEGINDPRWDMKKDSRIRFMDLDSKRIHDLTTEGRYYNPSISADGKTIAASEYPIEGGSCISFLSTQNGDLIGRIVMPGNLQVVETAWVKDTLYASVLDDNGYSIYTVYSNAIIEEVLPSQPTKIKSLKNYENGVSFVCDITGVNEIYTLVNGSLSQITSSKYGASEYAFSGNTLWFSNLIPEGRILSKGDSSPVASNVPFIAHSYPIADKLSEQEKELGNSERFTDAIFSEVKPYRKGLNLLHIHSWAPVYFNQNTIDDISFDITNEDMGIGATAFFQNSLGTVHGSAGYSLHKDEYSKTWKNSGHLKLTYEGFFPIFELQLDFNDRNNIQYGWKRTHGDGSMSIFSTMGRILDSPNLSGNLLVYVPLKKNSGGLFRGLVPQVKYNFSNDWFNTSLVTLTQSGNLDGSSVERFEKISDGKNIPMQSITASVRGYIIQGTPSSSIFPKLGVGFETGFRERLGLSSVYKPSAYIYTYGYLPGATRDHGFKLSTIYQHEFGDGIFRENVVNTRPRGFADSSLSRWLANNEKNQFKFSVDYAMPILPVDWSFLCPLFYIRNFEIIPHFDLTTAASSFVYSAGSEFNVHLGNFLWLPYDTKFGITCSYNGGPAYNKLLFQGVSLSRSYVGVVFNVSM
ncbi:MAG: hypothetical protein MJZ16_02470 [Bacteroidales bacterium]|nr:hypothetical protein [Bacteroidales bacterium]